MSARGGDDDRAVPSIGVGMLGHGFMGRAHVHALRSLVYLSWPPPLIPRLVSLAGRDFERTGEAGRRYGFEWATTDWRETIADPDVGLFDNVGPNDQHAEPTLAALAAGKHAICEKPLGRDAAEAHEIWRVAEAAGAVHMCGFNYRFAPAVRLARDLIAGGDLGDVHTFRGCYLQDWLADPAAPHVWRLDKELAGSGALGDIGAHVIDLARYLVGEIVEVDGRVRTVIPDRPGGVVDVDDAFESTVVFAGGAKGSIAASRLAHGHRNSLTFEVSGTRGSLSFDLERLNELLLYAPDQAGRASGFSRVLVTDAGHPYIDRWWPPGHVLGWADTFVDELRHLLDAIAGNAEIAPHGASFEDGYRAAEVCDAILRSSDGGSALRVVYRD